MNIDAFIRRNDASWARLGELAERAGHRRHRLTPAELDEMVQLYQRTSAQLSHARVHYRDQALTMRLTTVVADANAVLYGAPVRPLRSVRAFFAWTFPAAVWQSRWFIAVAAAVTFVPAFTVGAWVATSDQAVDAIGNEAAREAYVEEDFEAYYSSAPAAQFSTEVLVNNIQVSFVAFVLGIACCVGTIYILGYNGVGVGVAGGLFHSVGEPGRFWGLILPHGLLELTAVVIAGAAGLRLGWSIIAPGDRTRGKALADEAQRSVVLVMGLTLAFGVAALIEGYVTPSPWSTPVRVAIGVLVELAFVLYVVSRGRAAARLGYTGGWGEVPSAAPTGGRVASPPRRLTTVPSP